MRFFSMVLLMAVAVTCFAQKDSGKSSLAELVDERLELNKQYKQENLEALESVPDSERIKKYEAGTADSWIELLEYAKLTGDARLQAIVLRLEYREELRAISYDLQAAQSADEKTAILAELKKFEAKLAQLPAK